MRYALHQFTERPESALARHVRRRRRGIDIHHMPIAYETLVCRPPRRSATQTASRKRCPRSPLRRHDPLSYSQKQPRPRAVLAAHALAADAPLYSIAPFTR